VTRDDTLPPHEDEKVKDRFLFDGKDMRDWVLADVKKIVERF
jgi:hypothetical protein